MTQTTSATVIRGWVIYDGDCALCVGMARRFERMLGRRQFALTTFSETWIREQIGWNSDAPLKEMALLTHSGERFGGADAIVEIARSIWWACPLLVLARLPGVMPLWRTMYGGVAKRRHCLNGACAAPRPRRWLDWLPLMVLPAAALLGRGIWVPWVFMWVMSFALFFGCKWLTWRRAMHAGAPPPPLRSAGYLFAWPGMDAPAFVGAGKAGERPPATDWLAALAKSVVGAALIWGVVRQFADGAPLFAGWIGLVGIVFVLHFGLFHLLALAWRRAGINVEPIMRAPLLANSVSEFWGRRWNLAFHLVVHEFAFRPLRRLVGSGAAMLGVFAVSGVIHELVISLPAGGGYGWPTIYFLIQGAALFVERSAVGRRLGLNRGWPGWLFMIVVTSGTVFWLFHPRFIHHVILPFLKAIHAY